MSNEDIIREALARHYGALEGLAWRLVSQEITWEPDERIAWLIAQTTIKALEYAHRFDPRRGTEWSFIRAVMRGVWRQRQWYRRARKVDPLDLPRVEYIDDLGAEGSARKQAREGRE